MTGRLFSIVLATMICAANALAETPAPLPVSVDFGAVSLRLGMTQQSTFDLLSAQYVVNKAEMAQGVFFIFSKGSPADEHSMGQGALGSVTFKGDKVMAVSKSWITDPSKPADLGQALYAVVRELELKHETSCALATFEAVFAGGGDVRSIEIVCRQRKITVEVFNREQTRINEWLVQPQ